MSVEYLDLADDLAIAAEILGLDEITLQRVSGNRIPSSAMIGPMELGVVIVGVGVVATVVMAVAGGSEGEVAISSEPEEHPAAQIIIPMATTGRTPNAAPLSDAGRDGKRERSGSAPSSRGRGYRGVCTGSFRAPSKGKAPRRG